MWFFIVRTTIRLDGTPEREVVGDGQASWLAAERLAQRLLGSEPYAIMEATSPAQAISGRPEPALAPPSAAARVTGPNGNESPEMSDRLVQVAEVEAAFPAWSLARIPHDGQIPWMDASFHYRDYALHRSAGGVVAETA